MKPVLVVRHVPHESLGTLEGHLTLSGLAIQYVDLFDRVPAGLDWEHAGGLIVMGGPMNVDEVDKYPFLKTEVEWIQAALARELPLLGICLGAQLLAKSLGARVYPNGVKEIGWYQLELTAAAADDRLLAGSRPVETVFQWHGDTFELPAGAVHLAQTRLCRHQAFRHGANAYGLQFHVEMTPEMVADWLAEPENRCELAALTYVDAAAIGQQTPQHYPAMAALGSRVLSRFAGLCRAGAIG